MMLIDIKGVPEAWPRPTFLSWIKEGKMMRRVINKKKDKSIAFRNKVMDEIKKMKKEDVRKVSKKESFPLFEDENIALTIWFCMPLPQSCFVNKKKVPHKLRGLWRKVQPCGIKSDIDNLAKFVLDALDSVLYEDDKWVVKLTCYKVWDNLPPYEGRTIIQVEGNVDMMEDFPTVLPIVTELE